MSPAGPTGPCDENDGHVSIQKVDCDTVVHLPQMPSSHRATDMGLGGCKRCGIYGAGRLSVHINH